MAVTDLTNTKWLFNDYISCEAIAEDGPYSLIFNSNNSTYTILKSQIGFNYDLYYGDTAAYLNTKDGAYWTNEAYKNIEIIGGRDVENSILINWLTANATQIIEPATGGSISVGSNILQNGYIGNSEIDKMYYGATLIYEKSSPTPTGETILDHFIVKTFDPPSLVNNAMFFLSGYSVSGNITNGSLTILIEPTSSGTAHVKITADSGYGPPSDASGITVTNATISEYKINGELYLENITGNVTITATCGEPTVSEVTITITEEWTSSKSWLRVYDGMDNTGDLLIFSDYNDTFGTQTVICSSGYLFIEYDDYAGGGYLDDNEVTGGITYDSDTHIFSVNSSGTISGTIYYMD